MNTYHINSDELMAGVKKLLPLYTTTRPLGFRVLVHIDTRALFAAAVDKYAYNHNLPLDVHQELKSTILESL